jgi:thiamine monophosphate synthase
MRRSNVEAVSAAIDGGITVVQLREKDVDGGDFLAEAVAVIKIARPRGVRSFVCAPLAECNVRGYFQPTGTRSKDAGVCG